MKAKSPGPDSSNSPGLDLLESARSGNTDSLTELIHQFLPSIRRRAAAYRLDGLPIDREDLLQEGLLGLLKAIRTFDPGKSAAFPYYASVCIASKMNSLLSGSKSLKHRPLSQYASMDDLELEQRAQTLENEDDPSNIVIRQEEREYMDAQIKILLSHFEQDALKLYLSGHSYEEMAKSLHTTRKAVDNALQRIRRKLRAVSL